MKIKILMDVEYNVSEKSEVYGKMIEYFTILDNGGQPESFWNSGKFNMEFIEQGEK
jgi:hypothetical protein